MNNHVNIITERFLLRELLERDATERYLNWFDDSETKKFITSASTTHSLSVLRQYILQRIGRNDILFLGIFENKSGLHIGNIKYEPVNTDLGFAIMGIMIGDLEYRGKGVGTEVLIASAQWLKVNRNINQILLGVSKNNPVAIRSYEKAGFLIEDTPYLPRIVPEAITMVWYL